MEIYLVRHGETAWNKQGRVQGSADIPLNEYGIELAEVTAEALKDIPFEVVYTSPLIRARQTAEILRGKRNIPLLVDDRLQEMGFGCHEGTNIREARADETNQLHDFLEHPERYRSADGEDFIQVITRARSFIEEVLLPLEGRRGTVLIAAHGAFIRCFLRCVEKRPIAHFWRDKPQGNCAVSLLELKEGKLRILEEGKLYYETDTADRFAR